ETVVLGGTDGVVADHVAAARVDERNGLRSGRVAALPVVGAAARVLDQIPLDHQVAGVVLRVDGAVHPAGHAPHAGAAQAPPARDVAVFHHDVLNTPPDQHAVDARTAQFQAAQNNVVGLDDDVRVREVEYVARESRARSR